jgi:hypothetical protein
MRKFNNFLLKGKISDLEEVKEEQNKEMKDQVADPRLEVMKVLI